MDNEKIKQLEDTICDCATGSTTNRPTIVYARVDRDNNVCTITGGNIFEMVYGLSKVINHMSKRSGAPTSLIIKMITDTCKYGGVV